MPQTRGMSSEVSDPLVEVLTERQPILKGRLLNVFDDIVRFEYIKKTNKERGAALVGIELRDKADLAPLLLRMDAIQLNVRQLGSEELLYDYIV